MPCVPARAVQLHHAVSVTVQHDLLVEHGEQSAALPPPSSGPPPCRSSTSTCTPSSAHRRPTTMSPTARQRRSSRVAVELAGVGTLTGRHLQVEGRAGAGGGRTSGTWRWERTKPAREPKTPRAMRRRRAAAPACAWGIFGCCCCVGGQGLGGNGR